MERQKWVELKYANFGHAEILIKNVNVLLALPLNSNSKLLVEGN